jgi:hypothetical protein
VQHRTATTESSERTGQIQLAAWSTPVDIIHGVNSFSNSREVLTLNIFHAVSDLIY